MRADYRCPRRVTGHGLPLVRSPPCGIRVGVKTASSLALAHADGHRTWIR